MLFTDCWRVLWVRKGQKITASDSVLIILTLFQSTSLTIITPSYYVMSPSVVILCCFLSSTVFSCLFPSLYYNLIFFFFLISLSTPLLPHSLASMCLLGLRTGVFPALARPLMACRARGRLWLAAGRVGCSRSINERGGEQNGQHGFKLTWVWSKCHPSSFHFFLHPCFFQMALIVFFLCVCVGGRW